MTSKFLTRSLIAAVALTAVCEVPAQSKKVKRSKASPAIVLEGEKGERVRNRLEQALDLLRSGKESREAHEHAIDSLKAAISELDKGEYTRAKALYHDARKLLPDYYEEHYRKAIESARHGHFEVVDLLAQGQDKKAAKKKVKAVRAGDVLESVQGTVVDSEGNPVAGTVIYDVEGGEPIVGRIVLDRDHAKGELDGVIARIVKDGALAGDVAKTVAKIGKDYHLLRAKKQGDGKKKGGVAYIYDDHKGGDDAKQGVIYGRLDDDGRLIAVHPAKKDGAHVERYGVSGSKSPVRVEKDVVGGFSFTRSSGGDEDIVKAIQGVRDELRAIRKLMAKAHSTMDGGKQARGSISRGDSLKTKLGEHIFFGRDMTDEERDVRREVIKSLYRHESEEHGEGHGDKGYDLPKVWVEKVKKATKGNNGWLLELAPEGKQSKDGEWVEFKSKVRGREVGADAMRNNVFEWHHSGEDKKADSKADKARFKFRVKEEAHDHDHEAEHEAEHEGDHAEGHDRKGEWTRQWRDVIGSGVGEGGVFSTSKAKSKAKSKPKGGSFWATSKDAKSKRGSFWTTSKDAKSKGGSFWATSKDAKAKQDAPKKSWVKLGKPKSKGSVR